MTEVRKDGHVGEEFELVKNSTSVVRATRNYYEGCDLLDLRICTTASGSSEGKPTKRGISLAWNKLPELIDILTALLESHGGGDDCYGGAIEDATPGTNKIRAHLGLPNKYDKKVESDVNSTEGVL